jgi:hypothetical protein
MWSRLPRLFSVLVGTLVLSGAALGQVTTGTILGTVHDTTGAAVSAATVTITDPGKGTTTTYQTDEAGNYNAPFLIPSTYNIVVQKQGFKRGISNNIVLDVDQKARVDFSLEVGQVSETVEVTAAAPLIRMDSAELGEVVGKTQVQALPLNGRNFAQLVYLVPGVTPGQAGENLSGSSSFNPRAASDFNALGSEANANEWLVDGIDDNEWTFNTVMVQPSVESIAEFKVLTGTYSAEFGRGAGVISVSTRSGSNAFHGEAFDYLRNSSMDARNYFNYNGSNPALPFQKQPAYRRNQFGGAIGGPIKKGGLFFFADYYGQRSLKGIVNLNSVPTDAERNGDFSNYRDLKGNLIPIYNPYTTTSSVDSTGKTVFQRQPFPQNIIPSSLLNQVGLNLASLYPEPTGAGSFNNYSSAANQIIDDNGGNARMDYRIRDKDSIFARFSYERFTQAAPNPLVGGQGQCCLPTPASAAQKFDLGPQVAGVQNTNLTAQGLALNETHVFTARLVNEFRTGYARTNPFTFQSDFGHQSSTSLGIHGLNVSQYATGLPNIQIGGSCGAEFTCLQGGQAFLPAHPLQTNIQVEDAISWVRGSHQLKFGFRYVHQMSSPFTNTTTRGQMTFNDNFTNNPQSVTGTGSGLAALLLGFPNSGSRNYLQQPYFATDGEWAGFVQDNWRASPRLTLNLGLRYDVFTPEVVRHDRIANFDWSRLAFVYPGNGADRHVGMKTRYNDLGPRIGFSYDLTGKGTTVMRGGYGISFFPLPYSGSDELGQNPPFTVSQSFSTNTNLLGSAYATPCTPNNVGSSCTVQINNPFPMGVIVISPSITTNTALLNASGAAIISHQMSNPTPNVQSWNLDVERQLGAGLLEVAYAGSHTVHITFAYNPNEVQPGTTSVASRRLIQPLNRISTWVEEDEINASNYNALQLKYTHRYSYGLTALVAYTYGKSLDYGGSAASGGYSAGNPQTITCLQCGYGASGFDQKHRFVTSTAYELPFGPGKPYLQHGVASWLARGWEVDGIITIGTGNPFTVTLATGVNNGAPSWPNRIASGKLSNPKQWHWFDATAFVPPPANTYGNSARSVLYGPGIADTDLSLQRSFKIRESVALQLRGDAFNSFNHPNFLNPNASIGSATAGVISGTNLDNRDMQLSAKIVF